ncbi:hypothetical protein FO519_004661 [Halicephalobus sp. NKZ332]|nr:hypothetical protein FO519_004661 [Halicephalobus sp. NKZ332]
MSRLRRFLILFLFLPCTLSQQFQDYRSRDIFWQNEEHPIRLFDVPTVQEQTNFAFHNIQFENSAPLRQQFVQQGRQVDNVFIPYEAQKEREKPKDAIVEQISSLIPSKQAQEKVLEIVDSRDKSLLEKISDISKMFTTSSKSTGLDQSEFFHDIVENDRTRENVMHELKDSLNPEYKSIADELVTIQRNKTLSDNQKLNIQGDVLGSLTRQAKKALEGFETLFQRSHRDRRQLKDDAEVWNYRSPIYAKPGTESFPSHLIPSAPIVNVPPIPSVPPPTNGNYADKLTKNRFLMPTPLENRPQEYPPKGFFPQQPTRFPNFVPMTGDYSAPQVPIFEPPRPTTTPPPPTFGMDLSESPNTRSRTFEDRNRLFQRGQEALNQARITVWNDGSQFIERGQQGIRQIVDNVRGAISGVPVPQYVQNSNQYNKPPIIDVGISSPILQPTGMSPIIPINEPKSIGSFDTHINRYDSGSNKNTHKVILPENFMQTFDSKAPVVTSGMNPGFQSPVLEPTFNYINRPRVSPFGSNTGMPPGYVLTGYNKPTFPPLPDLRMGHETYIPDSMGINQARQIVKQGGFYPVIEGANSIYGSQSGPIGTHGYDGGPYGSATAAREGKPDNTRILTNNNIHKKTEPETVLLTETNPVAGLEFETPSSTTTTTKAPEVTPYTTYPDYRQILFPVPLNQAKADPRPATWNGRKQGMFGGGTNEYREDNGRLVEQDFYKDINNQNHWPSAIDDRRMKGYIDPAVRYGPVVSLENSPKPPYQGTSRASQKQGYMEGDDLSSSDVIGSRQWGMDIERSFTTPLPWNEQTTTIVSVPQIDIDSKLTFPANQGAKLSDKEIVWNRLSETAMKPPEKGQIRPYFGPEEITRSRYVNVNPPPNNIRDGMTDKFMKIDLPNTSTIS